jgi:hypothetical protein
VGGILKRGYFKQCGTVQVQCAHMEESRSTIINSKWCVMHHLLMSIYLIVQGYTWLVKVVMPQPSQAEPLLLFMYLLLFLNVMEWSCPQPSNFFSDSNFEIIHNSTSSECLKIYSYSIKILKFN